MSIPMQDYPNYRTYSNITPFTHRDGATFLLQLESLKKWIRDDLVAHLNTEVSELSESWTANTDKLILDWAENTSALIEQVNTAVSGVADYADQIDAAKVAAEAARDLAEQFASQSVDIQDSNVTLIFNNLESSLRIALESVFASVADVTEISGRVESVETDLSTRLSESELSTALESAIKTVAVKPSKAVGTQISSGYTGPTGLEIHDGDLYGYRENRIVRSVDDGATWHVVSSPVPGIVNGIIWCDDGEVVINCVGQVLKSNGWVVNPETATWATKITKSDPNGVGILRWGFDGDGTKIIVTEYSGVNRAESRYVWISTDAGNTFDIVLDKLDIDPSNLSHMHAACYDPWEDRFWLSHGHGTIRGTYFSDDDGETWTKLGGAFQPDAAPTLLVATDDGIIAASDSVDGGTYGIPRAPVERLEMRRVFRWQTPQQAGLAGFATRGYRDPKTGMVYVGFKSDFANVPSIIAGATARDGGLVWADPVPGTSATVMPVVTASGKLIAPILRDAATAATDLVTGFVPNPGVNSFDSGNLNGGSARFSSAVSAGPEGEAVSPGSSSFGAGAKARGDNATVIGSNAQSPLTAVNPTAYGANSYSGTRGSAFGRGATAGTDSTALGDSVATNDTYQTAIGPRSLMIGARSVAPVTPLADNITEYWIKNASGKMEKHYKFRSGADIIVFTEP